MKIAKQEHDIAERKFRLSHGDMHLSREDTTRYMAQLDAANKAKLAELQRDVEAKKLPPAHVAAIMEQYRVRILDKLYFETGIEEEDLQMGAVYARVVRRKIKKGKAPEKHRRRKPTPADLMRQPGEKVAAEEETKENMPADGEAEVQIPEEETREAVPAEGEVREKTADEAAMPSEESGEN